MPKLIRLQFFSVKYFGYKHQLDFAGLQTVLVALHCLKAGQVTAILKIIELAISDINLTFWRVEDKSRYTVCVRGNCSCRNELLVQNSESQNS